ncbi:F-box/LRR-repeat protein 25-like [Syzygium oleosum]|uniref:F-box/LRR-repeat protein 25-like n=1 Tax=Syzygium oleosum TaxID=219896 RepID=UPI0024BB8803|nr:F-box/LRR-repeat protein 25-like [Syzygium oleosum]
MAGTSMQTIRREDDEDYMSLLPECLIHHIFSFLTMRDVVKTRVLLKRWRSVWTTVSDIKLSVFCYADYRFVDEVLTLYARRKVKKFHLDVRLFRVCEHIIYSWLHFAVDHQVEQLFLNVDTWFKCWSLPLPPFLYDCSSLTELQLRTCHFSSHESISWSLLKSLSIGTVSGDVLRNILMGRPALEYLNLIGLQGVKQIHSRSLRELVIDVSLVDCPLEISTPCLLSLRVSGARFHEIIETFEAPSLVEAELDIDGPAKLDCCLLKELPHKLQNAIRILIGAWCLQDSFLLPGFL